MSFLLMCLMGLRYLLKLTVYRTICHLKRVGILLDHMDFTFMNMGRVKLVIQTIHSNKQVGTGIPIISHMVIMLVIFQYYSPIMVMQECLFLQTDLTSKK